LTFGATLVLLDEKIAYDLKTTGEISVICCLKLMTARKTHRSIQFCFTFIFCFMTTNAIELFSPSVDI